MSSSFDFNQTLFQSSLNSSVSRETLEPQFQYQNVVVSNVVGVNKSEFVYSGDEQSSCVKGACSDLFLNSDFEKQQVVMMKNIRNKRKVMKYEQVFRIQNIKSLKLKQPWHET